MKRLLLVTVTVALGLSLVACGAPAGSDSPEPESSTGGGLGGNVQLANPFTDHETLADAEEAAGFTLTLPDPMPDWVEQTVYRSMGTDMLEVIGEGAENQLRIRKGPASEGSISGVSQSFDVTTDTNINGIDVTICGTEEKSYLAEWQADGYAYSLYAENGLSDADSVSLQDLVAQVR